jgi:alpha-amylase
MSRTLLAALLLATTVALPALGQPRSPAGTDWRQGATCYEIFVRSFYDSDGDGIGDFNGLTSKLDYINDGSPDSRRDLGARCIWLMPVASSPSYHGYDVKNYYWVNPEYGTNADFKRFVAEAHRRGIKVLVDMVLNHASSEHPYFKDALLHPGSPYRAWFRFSPTKPEVKGPWGQEVWHKSPVRDEYYYGIFWHGMPDLNYETRAVREEAKKVASFWLDSMGVDGFRLDAIPYLVEENGRLSGTPGTHAFLREYAAHIRREAPHAFTVGEVWDSVAAMLPYYPDPLDAHFAFAASDALLNAVRSGTAKGLFDPFLQLQRALPATRWSPFLRNHDQTRTMTALGGDAARARAAVTLLLTMPGLPFIYYGEEIGMTGDKPDPRLRTPMHWRRGPAAGFTTGVAWEPLQPDSMTANVEVMDGDARSLLNLHRRLIHLRASQRALGAGELVPLTTNSDAVAAFVRRDAERPVLVVANLSATRQTGVTVTSPGRLLAAGRYALTSLLGGVNGQALRVGSTGRIEGYATAPALEPMEVQVLEISRR